MNRSSPSLRRRAARGVLGIVGLTCILSGPEAPDARAQGASKAQPAQPAPGAKPASGLAIPVVVRKLANGLTVVVSEDHSAPTFGVSTVYRIGFRLEPKGRTGFAHLFEHLMFEGSQNAPKGTLDRVIEGGGGVLNGSTRYDYTNYIASAPVSALEPILWLEADRMRALDVSAEHLKNQQEVVKEEIRVNVKNRPYGLFFWTDLAAKAFDRWENGHDGYGSFEDLDAAKLADVRKFYESYYGPGNAVIAICGDVKADEVFAKVEKYFGKIPARKAPPRAAVDEPLNQGERSANQTDALARVPAVAIGWKMPARGSKDQVPAAVLGSILADGDASRLYLNLVKGKELVLNLSGGLNWPLGDAFTYDGPTLLTLFALYKPTTDAKAVTAAVQEQAERIAREGVPAEELARVKTKMRADFYDQMELPLNRANALAIAQAFTGKAQSAVEVPAQIDAVTSEDLKRVAATYLTVNNRTVIDRVPAAAKRPAAPPAGGSK